MYGRPRALAACVRAFSAVYFFNLNAYCFLNANHHADDIRYFEHRRRSAVVLYSLSTDAVVVLFSLLV